MTDSHDSNSSTGKPRYGHVRTRRAPRAPMVTIFVSKETMDIAKRSDSATCMISISIAAQVPRATNVLTDAATIRWSDPDKGLRYTYLTPQSVRDVLIRWDLGENVEPFSFTLRGKFVLPMPMQSGKKRIRVSDWQKIKENVKKIRGEQKLDWNTLGDQIGIPGSTLSSLISPNAAPPSVSKMDKVENWVLEQTGERPAPRIQTQADQVKGPAQFRTPKSKSAGEGPQIIGGAPFPVSQTTRKFGLRMFRSKPE